MTHDSTEYRGKVRARDPETSWEAAARQTPTKTAALRARIYEALSGRPMTDEELLISAGRITSTSPSGVRTRRHELVLAGFVSELRDDDGQTVKRDTLGGSPSIVWQVARSASVEQVLAVKRPRTVKAEQVAPHDHERGMAAARKLSAWEIGDRSWADLLVEAYLNPEWAEKKLDEEQEN
jgi:hypothetical protein